MRVCIYVYVCMCADMIYVYIFMCVCICTSMRLYTCVCEDCFYYCSERNNVVVLFGTLKVQSFILTEVSDCGLLKVYTRVYVYVYAYLCIDCGSWYQCFSVWTVSCMRMCFRVHMHAYTYVCRYIYMCIFLQ